MAKSFGNKRSIASNPKDENREIRKAGNNDNIFGTNIVDSINSYAEAYASSISSALLGKQVSYNQLVSSFNSNKICHLDVFWLINQNICNHRIKQTPYILKQTLFFFPIRCH